MCVNLAHGSHNLEPIGCFLLNRLQRCDAPHQAACIPHFEMLSTRGLHCNWFESTVHGRPLNPGRLAPEVGRVRGPGFEMGDGLGDAVADAPAQFGGCGLGEGDHAELRGGDAELGDAAHGERCEGEGLAGSGAGLQQGDAGGQGAAEIVACVGSGAQELTACFPHHR